MKPQRYLFALLLLLAPSLALAGDTFLESDDYEDGEEIVDVFLKADDYRLMVEDIERNGEEFDWGWVKTAAAVAQPAAAEPQEKKGKFGRLLAHLPKRGRGNPAEPGILGFDLHSYKSVSLSVQNFAGLVRPATLDAVREAFTLAMQQMGLEVVKDGAPADLELGVAVVDIKHDSTYAYVATIEPFIELEVRLRDRATGENLILLRNQAHSTTSDEAAFRYADVLVKFLR
jgi:hypothetical protein